MQTQHQEKANLIQPTHPVVQIGDYRRSDELRAASHRKTTDTNYDHYNQSEGSESFREPG